MIITSLRLQKLVASDYKVTVKNNTISNWHHDIKLAISHTPNKEGAYEQVVQVIITKNLPDKTITLKTSNVFNVIIEGKVTDPMTEDNFNQYAELVQVSCSHARALFAEISKNDWINFDFFAVEPTESYYKKLKTNPGFFWN